MEIESVKIQGQGYLLNGSMLVPQANGNREYELIKEWLAQGNVPEPEFTEAELDAYAQAQAEAQAKADKELALSTLTVTTASGKTFDANNQARLDISNGILVSEVAGIMETTWRLADNSEVLTTVAELKEALMLALTEYARIKGIGV